MHIPVSEAKGHILELIRRAEAGEEIVLTRHGVDVVRLPSLPSFWTNQKPASVNNACLMQISA